MDFEDGQVNKAVSTLVMIVYEQNYRGTTLSMKAGTKLEDGKMMEE